MVKRGPRHFGFRRTSRRVKNVDIQTSWALVSPELRQPFVTRVDTGIGIVLQVQVPPSTSYAHNRNAISIYFRPTNLH